MLVHLFSVIAAFICIQSVEFETQSLSGFSFTINVASTTTTITIIKPNNYWIGIAFDSTTMSTSKTAVILDVSGLSQWNLGDHTSGTQFTPATSPWTVDETVGSSTTTYIISRDNDISGICANCYVFSSATTSIPTIYVVGNDNDFTTGTGHSMYHIATLSTVSPTTTPTVAPTIDVNSLMYETCVSDTQFVGSISLTLSRNARNDIMQIIIKGTDAVWFAFGFGSRSMQGTYAIVVSDAGIKEYILGEHTSYTDGIDNPSDMIMINSTMLNSNTNTWLITPEDESQDGIRTIKIIRPYDTAHTYDFTNFMSRKVNTLDVISAHGEGTTFMFHGIDNHASGSVTTVCTKENDNTPSPVTPGERSNSKSYVARWGFVVVVAVIATYTYCG